MSSSKKRSPFEIVRRLIVLVKPMLPIMLAAIAMGVAGHFCATFITIFGGFGLLTAAGLESPVASVGTVFVCILVFALLRGVLRYAEQASNHFIAFKLLALIRDKVFGALRRLTPAKLEGRDRGDLISLITADIEQLEVFYAHTISPVCIAVICVIGMTCFTASCHILPALVLLAGYLLVGVALPIWSAKRGDKAAREYRQTLADTNSYVLESLRGLRDTLQYQNTNVRAEGITAHSEALGEKQKAMKYREGVMVGATNTLILLTVLAVLGVSVSLYRSGAMTEGGVLICTLAALSSFGPVVALANLGASLTQVFASADRVLDLLDEEPGTADVTDGSDTAFAGAEAKQVSFAYAAEALTGRFIGARDSVSLRDCLRRCIAWGTLVSVVFVGIYLVWWRDLVGVFVDHSAPNAGVIEELAGRYIVWIILIPIASAMPFIMDGIMVGATETRVMRDSMFWATAAYFAIYYACYPLIGNNALWLAFTLYMFLRGVIQFFMTRRLKTIYDKIA